MTASANARPAPLSGPRKAAMFLMGVGDQVGTEVLRHLAPEEVRRIIDRDCRHQDCGIGADALRFSGV